MRRQNAVAAVVDVSFFFLSSRCFVANIVWWSASADFSFLAYIFAQSFSLYNPFALCAAFPPAVFDADSVPNYRRIIFCSLHPSQIELLVYRPPLPQLRELDPVERLAGFPYHLPHPCPYIYHFSQECRLASDEEQTIIVAYILFYF